VWRQPTTREDGLGLNFFYGVPSAWDRHNNPNRGLVRNMRQDFALVLVKCSLVIRGSVGLGSHMLSSSEGATATQTVNHISSAHIGPISQLSSISGMLCCRQRNQQTVGCTHNPSPRCRCAAQICMDITRRHPRLLQVHHNGIFPWDAWPLLGIVIGDL
jgi:hypothetical protein